MWSILAITAVTWFAPGVVGDDPPHITNFKQKDLVSPGEVTERGELTLPCNAVGGGLTWTWKVNDYLLKEIDPLLREYSIDDKSGELTKKSGRAADGKYQCFVSNSKGKTFSRKLEVKVTKIPSFDEPPNKVISQDVKLGMPATLVCPTRNGEGYGVEYQWGKSVGGNFEPLQQNLRRVVTPKGNMYIMYVTQDDVTEIQGTTGKQCRMSAGNTYDESYSINVRVNGQAPTSSIDASFHVPLPPQTTAVKGRPKTLHCIATGNPVPTIKWKKRAKDGDPDEDIVADNTDKDALFKMFQYGRTLILNNVEKSTHEGTYTCEAEQPNGDPIKTETVVTVQVPPFWNPENPPRKKVIDILGNGTLTCPGKGDPNPTFKWYRNGDPLVENDHVKSDGNKLQFTNVRLDEDAVYQCAVENDVSMIVGATWISVKAKAPKFDQLGPFYLFRGTDSKLKCEPDAAPLPWAEWRRNGEQIKLNERYALSDNGRTLTIRGVVDADKGKYTCIATNQVGSDTATGEAVVLDRTEITVAPRDVYIVEGKPFDLRCEAKKDASLELLYKWYKDGAELRFNSRVVWRRGANTLTVFVARTDDTGKYTCLAYTPEPKRSEASKSAIVSIRGAPDPPTGLTITNCYELTTELTWIPGDANNGSIIYYIVEQEDASNRNVFIFHSNVTQPNATRTTLNLTPWANLRFRMRAVNSLGTSRPSDPTSQSCVTKEQAPSKYPDNFRGVPKKAEELDIAWDPLTKLEQNAPGCKYVLKYRKVGTNWGKPFTITDPSVGQYPVPNAGYYELWEFQIQAENRVGPGPKSPVVQSRSGQDAPKNAPTGVQKGKVGARSIELSWNRVTVDRGSVDGYRIYYWSDSQVPSRKRRAIGANANFTDVGNTGQGSRQQATLKGLKPYTDYKLAIMAFNSGGESPQSNEVAFKTLEDVPGPPNNVKVYPFGKYILVTWSPPVEKNGIITGYEVGVVKYENIQDVKTISRVSKASNENRNLFRDLEFKTKYAVEVVAKTKIGLGPGVRMFTNTIEESVPAKPRAPTVEADSTDSVVVTFLFGLEKGGYPLEFDVHHREKLDNEAWKKTGWIDHLDTQSVKIEGLNNVLYEFKTVARNDVGESEESDTTDSRPLPGIVAGKRADEPIHKAPWFIVLLVVIVLLLLVLLILVLLSRRGRSRYPVGKRERGRAAILDDEPDEEDGIVFPRTEDIPPNYQSQGSLHKSNLSDSDRDSLDDYGEGPEFKEDGSFTREYGDDKDGIKSPDQKDQSAFATFV